jgi:aspartyl-tRNA(Asn)/glutamyl-tRNA(Gln) amidotransferase subunit A
MSNDLLQIGVSELLELYRAKKTSPVEVAKASLKQVLKYNPGLNALCFMEERATLHQARVSEKRWQKGDPKGPLDGVTVTIKDWFHVKGWPTRMGSKTTSALPQPEDSPVVAHLKDAGCVFIGKTTLPEFGHKGVTDSPLTGITRNPWNMQKTPGGSSGGAAVAAATGMARLNLGSDAGGSIRIPASFTGVFGFKPSPGIVAAWPPSLFSSFSSAGPLTRRVEDAAAMLDVISKPDIRDFNAAPCERPEFLKNIGKPLPKLKIALATRINETSAAPDVLAVFQEKAKLLQELGTVDEIALDAPRLVETFNAHWMAIASYMTASYNTRQKKDMDPRLLHWAARGDSLRLHDYLEAEYDRMLIGSAFKVLLADYDLIVTPTTAMTAFDAGVNMPKDARGKPWDDWTPFTYPANLAKLPAASLPCGMTAEGLPVGMQLMAGHLKDVMLMQAAKRMEELLSFTPWLQTQKQEASLT